MRLGGKLVIGLETKGVLTTGDTEDTGEKLFTTEDTEDTEERSLRFAGRTKASVPT